MRILNKTKDLSFAGSIILIEPKRLGSDYNPEPAMDKKQVSELISIMHNI
jgi:hypothetical protein